MISVSPLRHWPSIRLLALVAISGTILIILGGCTAKNAPRRTSHKSVHVLVFSDHTGSTLALQREITRYTTTIGVSAPPTAVIEACTFSSDMPIEPYYTGTIRKPARFNAAVAAALSRPRHGRGTYGAPLLRRVRQRLHDLHLPAVVFFVSDLGFDDLPEMTAEARLLANEPKLLMFYGLPGVSNSSAYTNFEAVMRPLGSRVRLAASADAPEAIREAQSIMRKAGR